MSVQFPSESTQGDNNNGSGNDDGDDGSDDGTGDDDSGDDGSGDDGQDVELSAEFTNSGPDPDAEGDFTFKIDGGEREARLKVDNLADGIYQFVADGVLIINFTIEDESADLKFSDPVEGDDDLPLTFDPRGKELLVTQGGTTFLTLQFPN